MASGPAKFSIIGSTSEAYYKTFHCQVGDHFFLKKSPIQTLCLVDLERGGFMRKLIAVAVLVLSIVGCKSTCKDGTNWYLGAAGGYQYEECKRGCCEPENPKTCKCSKRCSCWKDHSEGSVVPGITVSRPE
jgi:hypothetical protein